MTYKLEMKFLTCSGHFLMIDKHKVSQLVRYLSIWFLLAEELGTLQPFQIGVYWIYFTT